jgi:hypothetical protein
MILSNGLLDASANDTEQWKYAQAAGESVLGSQGFRRQVIMTCFISTYAQVIELSKYATKQVDHYQLFNDFEQEDDLNVSDWDKDSVSSGIDFKADAISTSNDFDLLDSTPSTK